MDGRERIPMMNGRSLGRDAFEGSEAGRALLRELDLVVAVGELESMRTGRTLYDDDLKARVSDMVAHLDPDLSREHLGTVSIAGGVDDGDAQAIARRLAGMPRGAMVVIRAARSAHSGIPAGIGHDAWMSTGESAVDTNSGHKFLEGHALTPRTEFRFLHGTVLGMIVHRQRQVARAAILAASLAADGPRMGDRARGDHVVGGIRWTTATVEAMPGGVPDAPRAWRVRMTKPGHGRSFLVDDARVVGMFGVPHVMPAVWEDDGNADRLASTRERREAAAHEAWALVGPAEGVGVADGDHGRHVEVEPDVLERAIVRRVDGGGHAIVGHHRTEFAPDSATPVSSTLVRALRLAA